MTELTIDCKCGTTYEVGSVRLDRGDIARVEHECGATAWVGRTPMWADTDDTTVAFVDEVPAVYINEHGGEILCYDHAGSALRSMLDAHPRRKGWDTPFGRFVRATEQDVAEFATSGLEFDCEECKARARRATTN